MRFLSLIACRLAAARPATRAFSMRGGCPGQGAFRQFDRNRRVVHARLQAERLLLEGVAGPVRGDVLQGPLIIVDLRHNGLGPGPGGDVSRTWRRADAHAMGNCGTKREMGAETGLSGKFSVGSSSENENIKETYAVYCSKCEFLRDFLGKFAPCFFIPHVVWGVVAFS